MFKFFNLFSGSSGNCSLVMTDNTKVLIDCGASCKKIQTGLNSIGLSLSDIDGILVTHEHSDHISAMKVILKNYGIPVFANKKTYTQLSKNCDIPVFNEFATNDKFDINDLKFKTFEIPHDAADPVGYSITHESQKISVATDIGHMTNLIMKNLDGSSFVLLESNYEPDMLKCSRYPYPLKQRILGPLGHLSNEDASETVSTLAPSGLKNIMLGHLSKENNLPELAYQTTVQTLISNNLDESINLSVANRSEISKEINIEKL